MSATTVGEAIRQVRDRLASAGVASPGVDAQELLAVALGIERSELFFHKADPVPDTLWEMVVRRERREPLQHITGTSPFGSLVLDVGPGVFIPRPETEVLAAWASQQVRCTRGGARVVVDLCAGSGALSCFIAHEVPGVRVIAVERSTEAAAYLRRNLSAVTTNADVIVGDVTDPEVTCDLWGCVDVVVANPPYVPLGSEVDVETTADPADAVYGGCDGLGVITPMAPIVAGLLRPGGVVGIEHDAGASGAVARRLRAVGLVDLTALPDLTGRERFTLARRPRRSSRHHREPSGLDHWPSLGVCSKG